MNVKWKEAIATIDRLIVAEFGERCKDYNPTCASCFAWRQRDELATHVEFCSDDDEPTHE